MVSFFHHTSPWTHRCLQCSQSAHRSGRVFRGSVQTACCYWIFNRGKSTSNWNSQKNANRLWWSVCWCEYSNRQGNVVQSWRTRASKFEWQNTKDGFQKLVQHWRNYIEVRGDFIEKCLCSFENNWSRHNSFFYFIKIYFPVHFLFKCRKNFSARPRIWKTIFPESLSLAFQNSLTDGGRAVALLLKAGSPRIDSWWGGNFSSGLFFISSFSSPNILSQKWVST